MLNTYDHEDAEPLRRSAEAAVPAIKRVVDQAVDAGAPVIYVNDSHGDWGSDRATRLERLGRGPYAHLVEPIAPSDDAILLLKARHSIFYQTPLEYLLHERDVDSIVMVGQVTEQCILYSALDAHIRHFSAIVPRDAVAHIHEDLADAALRMMERNMAVEVCDAREVTFEHPIR
jgi:nicotinamidase-related amidase